MKIAEMRALNESDLLTQVGLARQSLFQARMRHSLHQLQDTAELKRVKHRLAQLKTVLREKGRKL